MKCKNHPDRDTVGLCALCSQSFCEDCLVERVGKRYCPECLEIIQARGHKRTPGVELPEPRTAENKAMPRRTTVIIAAVLLAIIGGFLRIYYGGGIGIRIVAKHSFSFKDTIVNLDNLFGQPRIVIATKHPAVKRQLEEMGIIETDEQVEEQVRREIEEESKQMMREIEEETKRLQRELGF